MRKIIKFILVFFFAFAQNVFAQFVNIYCDCCDKKEDCRCYPAHCYQREMIDTNLAGVIRTMKGIESDSTRESITVISDVKGNLIFTDHYIWKGEDLVQMTYNGVTSTIVNFPDPCYFVAIEPSGDSIAFRLDPKSKFELPKDDINFLISRVSPEYKFVKDTTDKYEFIKYHKREKCREYHRKLEWIEDKNGKLFHISKYKHEGCGEDITIRDWHGRITNVLYVGKNNDTLMREQYFWEK